MHFADCEYLLIFGVFFICVIISTREGGDSNKCIVYPDASSLLKALCCLVIVCHHFALRTTGGFANTILEIGGGSYALVIFLFLSSYGIAKSEIKHPTTIVVYAKKRIWKLMFPYIIITVIAIGIYFLVGANADPEELKAARVNVAFVELGQHRTNFTDIYRYIVGCKTFSSSMWFVGVTLCSYLIFGIAKSLATINGKYEVMNKRGFLLTIYILLLTLFAVFTYTRPDDFPAHYYRNLWVLVLGLWVALYENEILKKSLENKMGLYFIVNVLMILWVFITSSGDKYYVIFVNLGFFSILLSNELFKKFSLKRNSMILYLAGISYYIYLIHDKVLTITWWYLGYISSILIVIVCLILSIITNRFVNYVLRK